MIVGVSPCPIVINMCIAQLQFHIGKRKCIHTSMDRHNVVIVLAINIIYHK